MQKCAACAPIPALARVFLGQEMVIAHRARQRGLAINADTVAELVAEGWPCC